MNSMLVPSELHSTLVPSEMFPMLVCQVECIPCLCAERNAFRACASSEMHSMRFLKCVEIRYWTLRYHRDLTPNHICFKIYFVQKCIRELSSQDLMNRL